MYDLDQIRKGGPPKFFIFYFYRKRLYQMWPNSFVFLDALGDSCTLHYCFAKYVVDPIYILHIFYLLWLIFTSKFVSH